VSILPFFCFFCKFFAFFVFGRVGLVFGAFWRGSLFDLLAVSLCLHVSGGAFSGFPICQQKPGAGVFGSYLLYGAKTTRRETLSGGGFVCCL
jgi:hypothetical protein